MDEPPLLLYKVPHLITSDSDIWKRFLQKYPRFFDAVSYDVHVGEGITPPNETNPNIIKMAISLTQRRIDVLAERQGRLWIVELKKDPGITILGQLKGYDILFRKKVKTTPGPRLCAIINRIDPDLEVVLKQSNVKIFVV